MAQEVEVKPEGPTWLKEETGTHELLRCGEYSTPLLWHGPLMENTQVRGRIKRQWGGSQRASSRGSARGS